MDRPAGLVLLDLAHGERPLAGAHVVTHDAATARFGDLWRTHGGSANLCQGARTVVERPWHDRVEPLRRCVDP